MAEPSVHPSRPPPSRQSSSETGIASTRSTRVSRRPSPPALRGRAAHSPIAAVLQGLLTAQAAIDHHAGQAAELLAHLAESQLHEHAGYGNGVELAEALLRDCPILDMLLEVAAPSSAREPPSQTAPRSSISATTGDSDPKRPRVRVHACRRTGQSAAAFARLSEVRARLRELELATTTACSRARLLLSRIERQKLYLECAYSSFEDFLSRALGPNPVFATLLLAPLPSIVPASISASMAPAQPAGALSATAESPSMLPVSDSTVELGSEQKNDDE